MRRAARIITTGIALAFVAFLLGACEGDGLPTPPGAETVESPSGASADGERSGDSGSDDAMAERAAQAIETARATYRRAAELVAGQPSRPDPEVVRLLRRAEVLLDDAQTAFGAERYRLALSRAQDSTAASRQVIAILTPGPRSGGG